MLVIRSKDINKQLEEGMMEYEKVSRQILDPNDTEVATIPNANAFDSVDFVFFSVNMMFDTHPLISKICIS